MKLGSSVWGRPTPPRGGSDRASSHESATPPSSPDLSTGTTNSRRVGAARLPDGVDPSLLLLRGLAQKLLDDEPTSQDMARCAPVAPRRAPSSDLSSRAQALRNACEDALGIVRDPVVEEPSRPSIADEPPPDAPEIAVREPRASSSSV